MEEIGSEEEMMTVYFNKTSLLNRPELRQYRKELDEMLDSNEVYILHDVYNMLERKVAQRFPRGKNDSNT